MRFDPKLIHPDEPPLIAGGELDLPADLAALGEQLGDDAAHLAAKYPARPLVGRSRAPSYSWRRASILAAGSTLAALLVAAVIWQLLPGRAPVQHTAAATPPALAPAMSPVRSAPAAADSVSLADLSGPELEALLDLLHGDPDRTTISF